jgi:hypothetical protein
MPGAFENDKSFEPVYRTTLVYHLSSIRGPHTTHHLSTLGILDTDHAINVGTATLMQPVCDLRHERHCSTAMGVRGKRAETFRGGVGLTVHSVSDLLPVDGSRSHLDSSRSLKTVCHIDLR